MPNLTIYEAYCLLQKQIDALEEKKEELRSQMAEQIPEAGHKDDTITAYWKITKKWKYSEAVDHLNKSIKEIKKSEEESGIAQCEETKQLNIVVK